MKNEFTASMVVVAEVDQITCWASLLQGIQMIAFDSQRLTTAVEAAELAMFAIAELQMDLTIQTSLNCFTVSSRKELVACLAGFIRRVIQFIMRTRITLTAGFASHRPYYLLQIISFLLWQAAAVQTRKSLLQVTMIVSVADRKCFKEFEITRKPQIQIVMEATVESFLRSLKCFEILLRIWIMIVQPQMIEFEFEVRPFLQIRQKLEYQRVEVSFVVSQRSPLLEYQCCLQ